MVFCIAMQLRGQQLNGIAVVLVSNYATQNNRGFKISVQFFSVFFSILGIPNISLGSTSGDIMFKMYRAIYWAALKGKPIQS